MLLAGVLVCARVGFAQTTARPTAGQTSSVQTSTAEAQGAGKNGPVLRATTRLVQLNVIVEDRHGKAVGGLRTEDFQLLDNGKPQKIALFVS